MRNLWTCIFTPGSGCAVEYAVKFSTLVLFVLPNLISSKLVGNFLAVLGVFAMAPFAVLCVLGIPKIRLANLARQPTR